MSSGANAFEINDIQEGEIARLSQQIDQNVTMLHCTENLPPYQFARDRMILPWVQRHGWVRGIGETYHDEVDADSRFI
jgi:hypothetical protein